MSIYILCIQNNMKYKYKRKGIKKICITCSKEFIAYQLKAEWKMGAYANR